MAQPIKKVIQEAHPEVNIHPFLTLLVDGTNLLRISMADTKINTNSVHIGGIFQFLLQLKMLLKKYDFSYVYVFFDDEFSGELRYRIYNQYKANRDKKYAEHAGISDYMKKYNDTLKNMQKYIFEKKPAKTEEGEPIKPKEKSEYEKFIEENFARERDTLCKYFSELFIRWMIDEETEGDDLISYYVQNKKEEERIVIVSSDQDITQLISETVCIYDPRLKKIVSHKNFKELKGFPVENVVLKKIFLGDVSDNIGNISQLSEARLMELMPEIADRPVTVQEVKNRAQKKCDERLAEKKKPLKWQENIVNGVSNKQYDGDFYEINNRLVNLSEPLLTDNAKEELDSMRYNVQDPEDRTFENLYNYILEDDITDLRDSKAFVNFFEPFKNLVNKEKERYKKEIL